MHQVRHGDVAGEGLGIYADKATITIHLFVCEFFFCFFFGSRFEIVSAVGRFLENIWKRKIKKKKVEGLIFEYL